MKRTGEDRAIYNLYAMLVLIEEGKRLDKTGILETYLINEGFKKQKGNLYYRSKPAQLIELTKSEDGISYANKLNPNDNGKFTQFLQNRLPDGKKIDPNKDFLLELSAIALGLELEAQHQKKSKIQKKNPTQKKPRGKGL